MWEPGGVSTSLLSQSAKQKCEKREKLKGKVWDLGTRFQKVCIQIRRILEGEKETYIYNNYTNDGRMFLWNKRLASTEWKITWSFWK